MTPNTSAQHRHHKVTQKQRQQQVTDRVVVYVYQGFHRWGVEDKLEQWRQTLPKPRLSAKALSDKISEGYKQVGKTDVVDANFRIAADDLSKHPSTLDLATSLGRLGTLLA